MDEQPRESKKEVAENKRGGRVTIAYENVTLVRLRFRSGRSDHGCARTAEQNFPSLIGSPRFTRSRIERSLLEPGSQIDNRSF
jgi:hypothetical protein